MILLLLAWLIAPTARASVDIQLRTYEDRTAGLSPEELVSRADSLPWTVSPHSAPGFGQTTSRIWLRFRVPTEHLKYGMKEPLFVEITNGYLGRVALYIVKEGKIQLRMESGLSVPVSQRSVNVLRSGFHVFRIDDPVDPGAEYFLSAEGPLPISIPVQVWEAPELPFQHWLKVLIIGLYLGCLLMAVLSNLVIGISLRSRLHVNYGLFVLSMAWICLSSTGLSMQLFWTGSPWVALHEMIVLSGVSLLFYGAFLRDFLESRKNAPVLDRIFTALVLISALRSVWLLFTPWMFIAKAGILASAVASLIAMAIAVIAFRRGTSGARLFFASSLVFNVAIVVFLLQELGVIWIGPLLFWSPYLGTLIEVVLISLALADRLRQAHRELAFQRAAMLHADKIAAVGRMAGELAHEINNPLAIIHGNAVLISKEDVPPKVREFAQTIEGTVNRIAKVVRGMRAQSRDSRSDPFQPVPFDSILQDACSLCAESAQGRGVALVLPQPDPDLRLKCRGSEISQVLVNLLTNAFDASEGQCGPSVRVETRRHGALVEIAVIDNGPGVPPEHRARILEPFYTTKEAGKGIGLGLSISRTIVESHGGKLWLDEAAPGGRFVFTVPLAGP